MQGDQLAFDDGRRVEDITRLVVQLLAAKQKTAKDPNVWLRWADGIKAYWPVVLAATSAAIAAAAWGIFGVSPIESYRETAHRRQQREFQQELARMHLNLGTDFLNVGQIQAAKTEFTRVRELDPFSVEGELGLLKVAVFEPIAANNYDPEVVQRQLEAILKRRPGDTHAFVFLGNAHVNIDRAAAGKYFDSALESDPANASAYFGKGLVFDLDGRRDEAIRMYEKAASLSKWNQTFLNNLAYQYYLGGDYRLAAGRYRELLGLDARYHLSYCMLANTQLMLGDAAMAYAHLLSLDAQINDGVSAALQRNQGGWFFHVGESMYQLYTQAEHNAYARVLLALAAYLVGREAEANRYLALVPAASRAADANVRRIVEGDLRRLLTVQPKWAPLVRSFHAALSVS